jgi:hypothetical protein
MCARWQNPTNKHSCLVPPPPTHTHRVLRVWQNCAANPGGTPTGNTSAAEPTAVSSCQMPWQRPSYNGKTLWQNMIPLTEALPTMAKLSGKNMMPLTAAHRDGQTLRQNMMARPARWQRPERPSPTGASSCSMPSHQRSSASARQSCGSNSSGHQG